jgi:hypothetical protein
MKWPADQYKSNFSFSTDAGGLYLKTFDLDGSEMEGFATSYTQLIGSDLPQDKVAYQFFKWMFEDKELSITKFFKKYGAVKPNTDEKFEHILNWAFKKNTPDRLFARIFF